MNRQTEKQDTVYSEKEQANGKILCTDCEILIQYILRTICKTLHTF